MNQKGSVLVYIVIAILLFIFGVAGVWIYIKNKDSVIEQSMDQKSSPTDESQSPETDSSTVESPDYASAKEKYNLSESQLEILSRVDSSRL